MEPSLCCKNSRKLLFLFRIKGRDERAFLPLSVREGIMHQETGVVLFHLSRLWIVHLFWRFVCKIWAAGWQIQLGESVYAWQRNGIGLPVKKYYNSSESSRDVFHFIVSGHNKIFTFSCFICGVLWSGFLSAFHVVHSPGLLEVCLSILHTKQCTALPWLTEMFHEIQACRSLGQMLMVSLKTMVIVLHERCWKLVHHWLNFLQVRSILNPSVTEPTRNCSSPE